MGEALADYSESLNSSQLDYIQYNEVRNICFWNTHTPHHKVECTPGMDQSRIEGLSWRSWWAAFREWWLARWWFVPPHWLLALSSSYSIGSLHQGGKVFLEWPERSLRSKSHLGERCTKADFNKHRILYIRVHYKIMVTSSPSFQVTHSTWPF